MDMLHILNAFANSMICLGMILFFVLLFGNENSIVNKWPLLRHWSLKVGLVTIIASSAWNALNFAFRIIIPKTAGIITYTQTPVGEIMLNVGLAILFVWVVYFHKYHFLKVAPLAKRSARRKKKSSTRKRTVKK